MFRNLGLGAKLMLAFVIVSVFGFVAFYVATWIIIHDCNLTGAQARIAGKAEGVGWIIELGGLAVCVLVARMTGGYVVGCINRAIDFIDRTRDGGVTELYKAIAALEDGDLTVDVGRGKWILEYDHRDEFAGLATAYNSLLHLLRDTIDSFMRSQASLSTLVHSLQEDALRVDEASSALSQTAEKVTAGSEEITANMIEVEKASEQSAKATSEVAQGNASQSQSLTHGSELVKELAEAVKSVAVDAESATQASERAKSAASGGAKAVNETVAGMNRIQATVDRAAGVVRDLGSASSQIGDIVVTIEEIADQTNLLALNAAIEAARAGEAGRGFAVVADEVRKLAERSREATREIGELITTVQGHTKQAVESMESGTREVEAGAVLANQAGAALEEIQSVVVAVASEVGNICVAAEEMLASSEEVSSAIADVAAIVEQSSAAAEEMSASSEEVSASISSVAASVEQQNAAVESLLISSQGLAGIAHSLDMAAARFKTRSAEASTIVHHEMPLAKAA
jgi:methyl-accepting chemotaxis protein